MKSILSLMVSILAVGSQAQAMDIYAAVKSDGCLNSIQTVVQMLETTHQGTSLGVVPMGTGGSNYYSMTIEGISGKVTVEVELDNKANSSGTCPLLNIEVVSIN